MLTDFHARKAALERAGFTQTDVGRRVGHSQAYVHAVLKRERRSAAIEAEVARLIGQRVDTVFPPSETVTADEAVAAA